MSTRLTGIWIWICACIVCLPTSVLAQASQSEAGESSADAAGVLRSSGPLDISAPGGLVLGRDVSARVTFVRPEGTAPKLLANTGRISDVEETADGRLAATFTLPDELFPQVAIVAVVSEGSSLLDWIAIPLAAEARIESKTEPKASVQIRIGETAFGPVVADKKGQASILVTVPPGIDEGVTIATDSVGNKKHSPLDLGVPAFPRAMGICPEIGDRLLVLAVNPFGEPALDAKLEVGASSGDLAPPKMREPGVYEAGFTVAEGAQIGDVVDLEASLKGDDVSSTKCDLKILGGRLAKLLLTVDPQIAVAGSETDVSVRVEFLDDSGHVAQPVAIDLEVDLGTIGELRALTGSKFVARWKIPNRRTGQESAGVSARTRSDSPIAVDASVELSPGPMASLELSADESSVAADGRSTLVVSAIAVDEFGNRIIEASLRAAAGGQVGRFTDHDGDGIYQAVYTAPRRGRADEDSIVVTEYVNGVEESIAIRLLPSRGVIALGPRIGYVNNFGQISSLFVAADLSWRLPFLTDLSIGAGAGYYWSDDAQQTAGGEERVETSIWAVPILGRLAYQIPIEKFAFYLGAAGGVVVSRTETNSPSTGRKAALSGHPGVSGIFGMDLSVGPGRIVVEAEYLHTFTKQIIVDGNVGGLFASAGYRFEF